jgi:hypothetical protein
MRVLHIRDDLQSITRKGYGIKKCLSLFSATVVN